MSYEETLEAFRRGSNDEAERLARSDLEGAIAAGDVGGRVDALCMLARVALRRGDMETVRLRATEARAVAVSAGERALERMPLHLEAVAMRMTGQIDPARALYRESIRLNEDLGETRMAALEHRNLAYVELRAGEHERVRSLIGESRRRLAGVATDALMPYLTFDEATVAALEGETALAAAKLAEAEEQFRVAGIVPDPDDAAEIERLRRSLP